MWLDTENSNENKNKLVCQRKFQLTYATDINIIKEIKGDVKNQP